MNWGSSLTTMPVEAPNLVEPCTIVHYPPSKFTIFFLPIKSKGLYNHGIHISPILSDSLASPERHIRYEIWRTWEDILLFQQRVEEEYTLAARDKKRDLSKGKGVKTLNGFYKQNLASSFESLPLGPDPKSISHDIHAYIPAIKPRATLFKPNRSTLEQRQKDFMVFIDALFSDDMPTLIREIRESHTVTEFFGLWEKDYKRLVKSSDAEFDPLLASIFKKKVSNSFTGSNASSRIRHMGKPSGFSDSWTFSGSSGDGDSSMYSTTVVDGPTAFGHNPQRSNGSSSDAALDRMRPLLVTANGNLRASGLGYKPNRNFRLIGPADGNETEINNVRDSWQTMDSALDALQGLNLSLPHKIKEQKFRASLASISTFMTVDSAQAVIPPSVPTQPRYSTNISLSDFEIYDDDSILDSSDLLDQFPSSSLRPETPTNHSSEPSLLYSSPRPRRASAGTASSVSDSTTSDLSQSGTISIKAIHNSTIIVLRITKDSTFVNVREELYQKFVGQESVPLSISFSFVFIPQPSVSSDRSKSTSRSALSSVSILDEVPINNHLDWEKLISTMKGSTMSIRILDCFA